MSYIQTGIKGVDDLLKQKGIPKGYVVFILGGPGSGKTTFALQFLHQGAVSFNEPGVYVTLDEGITQLKANALNFKLDFAALEKQRKISIIDACPIRRLPGEVKVGSLTIGKRDFSLISLIDMIKKNVKEIGAKRIVVDPLAIFTLQYPGEVERRTAVFDLMEGIADLGCTSLFVSELSEASIDRRYQFEEFIAQGVITMRKIVKPEGLIRVFTIEKMRGVDHDTQPHPYKIIDQGIEVYPNEISL
ncbi:MAG: AAA family ATPase [Thaumarchaeota archaeon]|nr:AAA family ATPase [Nitrososphaerota archaeon]